MKVLLLLSLWATVIFPSGKVYTVELATTPSAWEKGLSGRESLGERQGMLFVFPYSQVQYFWMKGMKFSIDIIWIDENFTVQGFVEEAKPCGQKCPTFHSPVPVKYVLEVRAGTVKKEGLKVGDTLIFNFNR